MNCPQCGEVCHCHPEPPPLAVPQESADAPELSSAMPPAVGDGGESASMCDSPEMDASAWRDELSDRLNRYRARRKVRPPRYPSLSLRYDSVERSYVPVTPPVPVFEPVSNHALALDGMRQEIPRKADADVKISLPPAVEAAPQTIPARLSGAKIIEFPRFASGPPAPPADQLAEPVVDRPRILEAPEIVPPPPALGGITIEAAQRIEVEKRLGIDIPLQSASLPRRLLAGLIDSLIITVASAIFAIIFWKIAGIRPPLIQVLALAAGIPCVLWAAYQYLLIVYGGNTPGLRLAGLELARFDGTATSRVVRRWRVLASYLSAASLGMGYAWVFLDEDVLCWHDRITHTYLAPGNPKKKSGADARGILHTR